MDTSTRSQTSSLRRNYTLGIGKIQLFSTLQPAELKLLITALLSVFLYLRLQRQGDLPEFVLLYFGLFVVYLWASRASDLENSVRMVFLIVAFGFIFRLLLLPMAAADDIYRYIWEGHLQTQGINPYRLAPDSTALIPYRIPIWELINNKSVPAIYPPLVQFVNALLYLLFGTATGFKLGFILLDGMVMWAILQLLRQRAQNPARLIYYAWNPLVVVEIAGHGHFESLVVGTLLWAVYFASTPKKFSTVFWFAASTLSKFYSLLMLPFFWRRSRSYYWLLLPFFCLVAYLPYLSAGSTLFAALQTYSSKWRFNGSLFPLISNGVHSDAITYKIVIVILALSLGAFYLRSVDLLRQLYWATGAVLLLAPSLFPWYLIWIIPFFSFFPNAAWLLLSATSVLSYHVAIDFNTLGLWHENRFFTCLEYGPFFVMLIGGWLARKMKVER